MAKKKSVATKASPTGAKKQGQGNTIMKAFQKVAQNNKKRERGKKQKKDSQDQESELQELKDDDELNEESIDDEQNSQQNNSDNQDDSNDQDSGDEDDQDDDDDESSSSVVKVKPQDFAVKQMSFRQRRGTKMNALMARKKQEEQDPFWAQHKGLFGDLNAQDDDDEQDYVESSSGKDQFDSDFGDTESEHSNAEEQEQKKMVDEMDEDLQKQKKKRHELMKKINAYKQKPQPVATKTQPKQQKQQKVVPKQKKKVQPKVEQVTNRYIHQAFTQQQLLGQAAHTEYYNWLSLKKLISIETQKKQHTNVRKQFKGPGIVFRDKIHKVNQQQNQKQSNNKQYLYVYNQDLLCRNNKQQNNKQLYQRQVSYMLFGQKVQKISDLTDFWNDSK